MQLTHSMKAPGFNPRGYIKSEKNWSQAFAFKCNSYRYTWGRCIPSITSAPCPPTPSSQTGSRVGADTTPLCTTLFCVKTITASRVHVTNRVTPGSGVTTLIAGAMSSARDGGNSRVATVVANAAVYGDDFQWRGCCTS
jgi:hypothetical protein